MKIEDIIEALNRHIEDKRKSCNISTNGHLVLQKIITPNSTFKAYKTYEIIIWFVKQNKRYIVLAMNTTTKIINGHEEEIERDLNVSLCNHIFNWVGSTYYNLVINGEFTGINEEDKV